MQTSQLLMSSRPNRSVASITPLQQSLEATKIHDTSLQVAKEPGEVSKVQEWVDIDEPERNNSSYATEYATNVYQYMYKREVCVCVCGRGMGGLERCVCGGERGGWVGEVCVCGRGVGGLERCVCGRGMGGWRGVCICGRGVGG